MKKEKVAVALSGGVDSGVAAALMVKAGYQAAGFHMKLWQEGLHAGGGVVGFRNKCCDLESLEAARKTAHQLGIAFYVVDFEKVFKKKVVDYFLEEYASGLTPNPCAMCNHFIKFGELLGYVRKLGYDYLATGHYARIATGVRAPLFSETRGGGGSRSEFKTLSLSDPPIRRLGGNPKVNLTADQYSSKRVPTPLLRLLMGKDKKKDQSYFLYNLTQKQLAHVLFPVGNYLKKEVVAMAKKWKLPVYSRPESQEICFFPESDYRLFLRRQISEKIIPGEVVDAKGRVIGKHRGLPLYTIGQRKGLGVNGSMAEWLDGSGVIPPFYVIAKDEKKNQLIVGFGRETERREFWVRDVSWTTGQLDNGSNINCWVRIRHQGELLKCKIKNDKAKFKIDKPGDAKSDS